MRPGTVHVFENHDTAFYRWRELGARDRILVHVDAHHDAWALNKFSSVTIANFITPALQEGFVREVVWVVPDASFSNPDNRHALLRHLRKLAKQHGGAKVILNEAHAQTFLGRAPFRVCTRWSLPRFSEPVLLDIDTDYLVIPQVSFATGDDYAPLPWCWPEELLASLSDAGIEAEHATIAYSVEGGFTPLFWKYLGDELSDRLKGESSRVAGFEAMRHAVGAVLQGEVDLTMKSYKAAEISLPQHAAPHFHKALLRLRLGEINEAKNDYRRAVELDPSYLTAYRNASIVLVNRRDPAAEEELRDALLLDPQDAAAFYGMARTAVLARRWQEARTLLEKAIDEEPELMDAHRLMGEVQEHLGNNGAALTAYDESLRLALAGKRPLLDTGIVDGEHTPVLDPEHGATQVASARLLARAGRLNDAAAAYQIAFASKYEGISPRLGFACVLLRQKRFALAIVQLGFAVRALGTDFKWLWRRASRRSRRTGRPWRYAEFSVKVRSERPVVAGASTN